MAWLTIALKLGSSLLQSVKQNPKLLLHLLQLGAAIWIVVCCLTHCGSGNGGSGGKSDTVLVSDTVLIYDTSWKSLIGDTIAYYEQRLREPVWETPTTDYADADNCADSLKLAMLTLDYCDELLTECDGRYTSDYIVRGYRDTISDDTLRFVYDLQVRGRLEVAPKFSYQSVIPERVITNTITITNTLPPRRQMYVGGGIGPIFDTQGPDWQAMDVSLRLGYGDRKNNRYGVRAHYMTLNLWGVELEYTRSIPFGK